jgi:multidrug efflux pump subunit AcrA (membrane-fusion protein)
MHLSSAEISPPEQTVIPASPSPEPPPKHRAPLLLIIVAVALSLVVALLVAFAYHARPFRGNIAPSLSSARSVGMGVRLAGTTEAVHMRSIVAPMLASEHFGTLTITSLAPSGTRVHQGDVIAEFDRQAQVQEYINKQAEYVDLSNKAAVAQAKEVADRAKDETDIEQAESALSKAQLEMQKVELLSKIDAEKAQETVEEAKATLQQLGTTFDLKRQAAQAAIRLLEIQRDRAKQVMEHAQANATLMKIDSPIDGIVVLNTIWKEGKMGEVQEGDQVRPGITFMQVVDPSQMQVRALVNQEDFLGLRIGIPVHIHLDAYPDLVFSGKLEEMAPIGRNGDFSPKVRTFAVVFSIEGNDPRLMPDLSAAVDVNPAAQNASALWRADE